MCVCATDLTQRTKIPGNFFALARFYSIADAAVDVTSPCCCRRSKERERERERESPRRETGYSCTQRETERERERDGGAGVGEGGEGGVRKLRRTVTQRLA